MPSPDAVAAYIPVFDANRVDDLRRRLRAVRFPPAEIVDDWAQGVPLAVMKTLVQRWLDDYDMNRVPDLLGRYENVTVGIDGVALHAVHVRSPRENAHPLVLLHGWPGSVLEFSDVIGPLTDPESHGGRAEDAFHLIIPSLPGFGFSQAPSTIGWGTDRVADAVVRLTRALGYDRFGTQGGDWGSTVALKAGQRHPQHVCGVHVNFGYPDPARVAALGELTAQELVLVPPAETVSGHLAVQSTVPQTLGYALADSPTGQAAWIVDKLHRWTDPSSRLPPDRVLDFVMLYWMTNTATTSARLYWEGPLRWVGVVDAVPVGYTRFPFDTRGMSERMARTRFPRLGYYAEARAGGHFAAAEQPAEFVHHVRAAFRQFSGEGC